MILLTEIVWRWSFGAIAFWVLLVGSLRFLVSVHISPADTAAWRSNNPTLMAQALANVVVESGSSILKQAFWVLPVVTLVWMVFGTVGRTATLNRLAKDSVSLLSILALHCSRALLMWLAGAALVAAMVLNANISTRGAEPDLFLYYALAFWSVVLIGGFWAIANWYLSVAALCCLRSGAGFLKGTGQAIRLARAQGGEFSGISLVFAAFRLAALAIAFVLCVLPSPLMATAPRGYTAWVVAVSLAYFAVADFLYISRMGAYFIVATHEDETARGLRPPAPAQEQQVVF
jgi:hypothetical protein